MEWQALAQTPMQSAEEIRRHLTDKAISDDDFRSRLLADPKETISQEFGFDVPEDLDVQVHQSDMDTLHLALPVTEMGEEQLEAIAAGRCCC